MNEAAVAGLVRRVSLPLAIEPIAAWRAPQAELLEGEAAYAALHGEWQRLARLQAGGIVFQTPDFLRAWARYFAAGRRLVSVAVRSGDDLVAVWPLAVERHGILRVARGAGAPIAQYDELLLHPGANARAVLATALQALRTELRPDLVLLERVRTDGPLALALQGTAPLCATESAPYVDLSRGAAAALAGMKPLAAKKQRKRVRRFRKEGQVDFAVAGDAATAKAWLGEALALKRDWLKGSGRISRAFVRTASGHCLSELAGALWSDGPFPRMVVARLTLDGRPAAYEAGFMHRGTFYLYLRSFAPALAVFGPGNILTEHMLGWCAENGIDRYDMLAPGSRNKSEWQSGEVPVLEFALPMTLGGRLYVEAVLKRLAPAIRNGFYALPLPLRASLAGVALRM